MLLRNVIPLHLRKRSYLTVIVIIAATISESFGLALIMPLLATMLGLDDKGGVFEFVSGIFNLNASISTIPIIIIIAFMFFLKLTLSIYRNYLMYGLEWMLRQYWMKSIFEHYEHIEFCTFEKEKPGHITNKIINETLKAASGVRQMFEIISQVLMLVFLSIILLMSNVEITLMILFLGGGIVFILKKTILNLGKSLGQQRQKYEDVVYHEVNELVHGMKTIRSFALEHHLSKKFHGNLDLLVKLMRKTEVLTRLPVQISEFIFVMLFTISFVVLESFYDLNYTEMLPFFGMLVLIATRLFSNIGSLSTNYMSIKVLVSSIELVEKYLPDEKQSTLSSIPKRIQSPKFTDCIKFENVSFAYDSGNLIFDNISMTFPKGKVIAIVGKTGAGKSSISKLLMVLYKPQSGNILIDNIELSDVDIHQWRKKIGYVEQEPFFFNGSILENLTHGDDTISDEMLSYALDVAHCKEFINIFPNGIGTLIGDKGSRLSGGQKARLALARAIIINPDILLLDEVTSALDNATELQIIDSLKKLKSTKTIIIITHDHEILNITDCIYKIENKKIVVTSKD